MTNEHMEDLLNALIFHEGDARYVVEAMGATYEKVASGSKQGGGDIHTNYIWPTRTGYPFLVEFKEVQDLRGIFRLLLSFNCRAELHVIGTAGGAAYEVEVWQAGDRMNSITARGRIPETALWVALIKLWRT